MKLEVQISEKVGNVERNASVSYETELYYNDDNLYSLARNLLNVADNNDKTITEED